MSFQRLTRSAATVALTALFLASMFSTAVFAGPPTFDPPVITVHEDGRSVEAHASYQLEREDAVSEPSTARRFRERLEVAVPAGLAGAATFQDTDIDSFSVSGEGTAEAIVGSVPSPSNASANSDMILNFTVPVDTPFSLSGTLSAHAENDSTGIAELRISTFTAEGFLFESVSAVSNGEEETEIFFYSGTLLADTTVFLLLKANVDAGAGVGKVDASFEFEFNVGDQDGDGLLDAWETDGLDFDNDGTKEIDLAALGADPLVKDIFVEVDVMADIAFDGFEFGILISKLEEAFENAPPDLVDNPGGGGINLHIITDGDRPPLQHLTLTKGEGTMPAGFWTARAQFFGSAQDRTDPLSAQILAAKARMFRYCLWADTFGYSVGDRNIVVQGIAEATPSGNFIIASGALEAWESYEGIRGLIVAGQMGAFMHELGHTLGLSHGGQDDINYKPHYLSVMNYLYSMPIYAVTNQGTFASEFFELDYSSSAVAIDLDETSLVESAGVGGGPVGRRMIYNSAPSGQVSSLNMNWVDETEIDWNNSGGSFEDTPYALDITRVATGPSSPPADLIDSYDQSMEVTTDWDKLVYDFSGPRSSPARGVFFEGAPVEPCFDEESATTMSNAQWNDHVADVIFRDSFESGTTSAWSGSS